VAPRHTNRLAAQERLTRDGRRRENAAQTGTMRILRSCLPSLTADESARAGLRVIQDLSESALGWIGLADSRGGIEAVAALTRRSEPGSLEEVACDSVLSDAAAETLWREILGGSEYNLRSLTPPPPNRLQPQSPQPGPSAMLVVGLRHEQRPLGMLALAGRTSGYSAEDVRFAQGLCEPLGLILHSCFRSPQPITTDNRHRLHQDLRDSERRYRSVFTQAAVGVARVAPDGALLEVNDKLGAIVGYSAEELLGKRCQDLTHPADRASDEELFGRVLDGATAAYTLKKRLLKKSGESVWVKLSASLVRDEAGNPQHLSCIVEDISDSEQTARALQDSRHDLGQRVKELHCLYEISRIAESIGLSLQEVLTQSLDSVSEGVRHPEAAGARIVVDDFEYASPRFAASRWRRAEVLLVKRRAVGSLELGYLDDPRIDSETPFRPEERSLLRAVADHLQRVIEQKRAAEAALQERATLKAVLDSIDDIVYVVDPVTYELLHVNEACRRAWGPDVVGRKCHEVLHCRTRPCGFCSNDKIFGASAGQPYIREWYNPSEGKWFRCVDRAINWIDGRLVRFEQASDISMLKNTERELRRANHALAQSNQDLEQFAYVASHDLQEPLRMVSSYLQLVQRRYAAALNQEANEFIDFAVDGATRMKNMINDLLRLSRIDRGGAPEDVIDCNEVFERAVRNLAAPIAETGAAVTSGPLPHVIGNMTQLVSLFQNLIANGIKFQKGGTPTVMVSAEVVGEGSVLRFDDNGIGIHPDHAGRIFGIFQRLHSRAEYEGTGIGLAMCQKIVKRHGGSLWVTSEPGKGSSFFVGLRPAARPLETRNQTNPGGACDERRGTD